jgi:RNA polymerase sigma factor FliA
VNSATIYASQQKLQQNEQVAEHLLLVKKIALHLLARLPASVELDDLQQAGLLGLLSAVRSYSSDQGASFATYAGIRIKGAMLDELRKQSWAPRSIHQKSRRIEEAVRKVEAVKGGPASDQDIADTMDISLEQYRNLLNETTGCELLFIEDDALQQETETSAGPETILQDERFRDFLATNLSELPEKEKMVMALYYQEELNLREIGSILEVSESRVSQIHSQALIRLRSKMTDWVS